ncbi:hypothetical protein [Desulfobulbus propionicus]|uniref:hypothetical protein n=1 Tax=Desulfobulbus propionicus TaxID=894 RepID=UPI00146BD1E8|nr:hypothetical protein [Desulfobulbus propionicus]
MIDQILDDELGEKKADDVGVGGQVPDGSDLKLHVELFHIAQLLQLFGHDFLDGMHGIGLNDVQIQQSLDEGDSQFGSHFSGFLEHELPFPLSFAVDGVNGFIGGIARVNMTGHGVAPFFVAVGLSMIS